MVMVRKGGEDILC